jgi:antitoxin component YwqK of YwqJK toxin-antitoxin module
MTIIKLITKQELIDMMPAHIIRFGNVHQWYKNGKLHRDDDMPAIIEPAKSRPEKCGVTLTWMQNGKIHRDGDQPAMVSDTFISWYKNDVVHRDNDQPAYITKNERTWYVNGELQRHEDYSITLLPQVDYKAYLEGTGIVL